MPRSGPAELNAYRSYTVINMKVSSIDRQHAVQTAAEESSLHTPPRTEAPMLLSRTAPRHRWEPTPPPHHSPCSSARTCSIATFTRLVRLGSLPFCHCPPIKNTLFGLVTRHDGVVSFAARVFINAAVMASSARISSLMAPIVAGK